LTTGGLLIASSSTQAQSLREGLEVYWNFDEGTGNMANDASGNDREAVPEANIFPGAVIDWSGGKFGGSVKFDMNYMLHSPFEYYGIGDAGARTISMWVKTQWQASNSSAVGAIMGWGVHAGRQRWHFKFNGGTDAEGNVQQFLRTENQGGNNFGNSISVNDGQWHHFISVFDPEIDANDDGIMAAIGDVDHYVDGVLENKNGGVGNPVETLVDPDLGAVPVTVGGGYFPNISAARLMEGRVDEVRIYSRALSYDEIQQLASGKDVDGPPAVEITNDIEGAELLGEDTPIEFSITPQGDATVDQADVFLELNGKPVIAAAKLSGSPSQWTGTYSGLEKNRVYTGRIGATDSQGRTYAFDFTFDTISLDNYAIEAEDYNFDGGAFFDQPVPCNTPGGSEANCYFDRVSTQGIDAMDSIDDDRPTDEDADYLAFLDNGYRFGPSAFRDELVDTWASGDTLRQKHLDAGEGILDYDLERVQSGEWFNYTRDLPVGTYQVLLRARGRADQTLSLGSVSNPTQANQTVSELGTFVVGSTGGSYRFFPLKDAQG
ncbi:MAG: LamG-like jellyroll fold domain-containing protein, partial [Verrucomicrobiota bacterium]